MNTENEMLINMENMSDDDINSELSEIEELKVWGIDDSVEDYILETHNRGLCRADYFDIAYGEIKRKQLAELKKLLTRESRECSKLKSNKKRLLQYLNSMNEIHMEQIETFLKLNNIKVTHYYLENQESNKILIYLKHELVDSDLEFKNSLIIGNCVVRISTEEVITHCNLLLAIEVWNRKETIEY